MKKLIGALLIVALALMALSGVAVAADLDVTTEVLEEDIICIEIVYPTDPALLDFGSLYPGDTSACKSFTLGNCGNVEAEVAATASTSFYTDNLKLSYAGHCPALTPLPDWSTTLTVGGGRVCSAQLTIPDLCTAGTYDGVLTFTAIKYEP